jgi:hypothetical protein
LPPDLSIDTLTGVITGSVSYDAAADSPYPVKVTVRDNGVPAGISSTTFDWTVTNTNRPPSVTADEYPAVEDQALNVPAPGVLLNDADPMAMYRSHSLRVPSHGNLTLNGNGAPRHTVRRLLGTIVYLVPAMGRLIEWGNGQYYDPG